MPGRKPLVKKSKPAAKEKTTKSKRKVKRSPKTNVMQKSAPKSSGCGCQFSIF